LLGSTSEKENIAQRKANGYGMLLGKKIRTHCLPISPMMTATLESLVTETRGERERESARWGRRLAYLAAEPQLCTAAKRLVIRTLGTIYPVCGTT
jgi:hypothetical protein